MHFTGLVCQITFDPAPINTYSVLSESHQLFLNCTIYGLAELQKTGWARWSTYVGNANAVGQQITINNVVAPSVAGDFRVEGTYNLVFLTRALSKAGQYSCKTVGAPVVTKYAEVIMLGKLVGEYAMFYVSTCLLETTFMCCFTILP